MATISVSTGGCSAAVEISQPEVAVSATPQPRAAAPSAAASASRARCPRVARKDHRSPPDGPALVVVASAALGGAAQAGLGTVVGRAVGVPGVAGGRALVAA